MNKISDKKILAHLANGIDKLTPEASEDLWKQDVETANGYEWYLDAHKPLKKRHHIGIVAACLAICLFASCMFPMLPSAAVYLDVNPGISLSVNYRNRVTGVKACNEEAAKVLGDLDFRGTELNVALYAILGSMVHNGYLTEDSDTILVSVSCANAGRAAQLEDMVSGMVSDNLKNMINAGEVLSHQVGSVKKEKGSNPFTPGKAAFVKDMEERYPQLKEDDLDDLTIDEIVHILENEDLDYSDYAQNDDDDDDDDDNDDDYDDEEHDD